MRTILVTGGAGFIGSNFVNRVLKEYPDDRIIVLDGLTYAGNLHSIHQESWENPRFRFRLGDIRDRETVEECVREADVVLHLAAQTHVDNSILWCDEFINTNIKGTQMLLDACKKYSVERFIYVSSSEVYGSAQAVPMTEEHPLNPQSPYAGTKAGADRLAYSYFVTYKLPVIILRPFNNYGPNQHTEKLIPCFVSRAINDRPLPLHGDGSSTRDWLHTEDTCRAFMRAMDADRDMVVGEVFNIGTGLETRVVDITNKILRVLDKPASLIKHLPDRRGQVRRHFACARRARELLGWEAQIPFDRGLEMTIRWYVDNQDWWANLKTFPGKEKPLSGVRNITAEALVEADFNCVGIGGYRS